jgi:hypothetical protein
MDRLQQYFITTAKKRAKHVQRRVLGEPGLTFSKALELAQAAETVEQNAR